MTENLEDAVEFIFENCIDDFEAYRRRGYEIQVGEVLESKINLTNNRVSVELNFPFEVKFEESTNQYRYFSKSVDFDLLKKYETVMYAMRLQEETPYDIPISDYARLAYEKDFEFEVIEIDENTFIYNFEFPIKYKENKYRYVFAARYQDEPQE